MTRFSIVDLTDSMNAVHSLYRSLSIVGAHPLSKLQSLPASKYQVPEIGALPFKSSEMTPCWASLFEYWVV